MVHVKDVLKSMDYGPAPEGNEHVVAWLETHKAGFGHFIDGKTWGELVQDYNIFAGRLWPVFLGIEALAPLLIYRFVMNQGIGRGQGPRPQGAV
jgi:hypothetical protein